MCVRARDASANGDDVDDDDSVDFIHTTEHNQIHGMQRSVMLASL